jgi:predicted small lipoprotein YifL
MKSLFASIMLILAMCSLAACGERVGARTFPVEVRSTPGDATAYLIPWDHWLALKQERSDDDLMRDTTLLDQYRVRSGLTSVTVRAPSVAHIVVVERNGVFERSDRFTPGTDTVIDVRLPATSSEH